jgi:hypothetical protein
MILSTFHFFSVHFSSKKRRMSFLNNIHWLHAVNSKQKWEQEILPFFSNDQQTSNNPLGIEVDIRFSNHQQIPVLAHDKILNETTSTNHDSVDDFLHFVLSLSEKVSFKIIVKLDIKERKAADAILQNPIFSQRFQDLKFRFQFLEIWFNVDVLPITPSKFVAVDGVSALDVGFDFEHLSHQIIRRAVGMNVFDAFSLGWIGCGNDNVVSYNRNCCQKMLQFVKENIINIPTSMPKNKPKITFAVRASFVVNDSEATRQLRDLCQDVRMLFDGATEKQEVCFLTFWRGRREVITEKDYEFAKEKFGNSWTIDSS